MSNIEKMVKSFRGRKKKLRKAGYVESDDKLSLEDIEKFHSKKESIPRHIRAVTDRTETVYGQRAVNVQVPRHLRKHTEDYDIYSENPKFDAMQLERHLDKKFGGNFFKVEPAEHPGTFKVIDRVREIGVADYSKYENGVPKKHIEGINYVSLEHAKKMAEKALADPKAKWRHPKDQDTVNRIKIATKGV